MMQVRLHSVKGMMTPHVAYAFHKLNHKLNIKHIHLLAFDSLERQHTLKKRQAEIQAKH